MATESQYVSGFDATNDEWTKTGSSPYLDLGDGSYVNSSTKKAETGYYDFPSFSLTGSLTSVTLYLRGTGTVTDVHEVEVYDGTSWSGVQNISLDSTLQEYSLDISGIIDTLTKLSLCQINIIHENAANACTIYHARVEAIDDAVDLIEEAIAGSLPAQGGVVTRVFTAPRLIEGDGGYAGVLARQSILGRLVAGDFDGSGDVARGLTLSRIIEGAQSFTVNLYRTFTGSRFATGAFDMAGTVADILISSIEEAVAGVLSMTGTVYRKFIAKRSTNGEL